MCKLNKLLSFSFTRALPFTLSKLIVNIKKKTGVYTIQTCIQRVPIHGLNFSLMRVNIQCNFDMHWK